MDEHALHAGLLRRDEAALAALMDAYVSPVYALCSRLLAGIGTSQDVEECVSDAFLAAWRNVARYHPDRSPLRTWVLMHAKYTALDRRRKLIGKAEGTIPVQAPPAEPLPEEALAKTERRQQIQSALNTLGPIDRALVYRRYFLDEQISDLAEAFRLSRTALDTRLSRARRALRVALGLADQEV